jgi:DNA-binding HxlR family transcriptional regulator
MRSVSWFSGCIATPCVEYEATERLRELRPVFQFLSAWAERYAIEDE